MRAVNSGALNQPPESGDGHDYDAIAFNVWQGRGFGYHWSDEAWRQPYLGIPRYKLLLTRKSEYYPTTYRPPAMPYLLSVVYALTDRSFAAWRVLNCGITAGGVTTAAVISAQFVGLPGAVLTAAIALQSRELTRYSGMFMTETLATFFVTLLAWAWMRNARQGWSIAGAVTSGVVFGALIASRTLFVLWTPLVLILPGRDTSFGSKFAWRTQSDLPRGGTRDDEPLVHSKHGCHQGLHAAGYAGGHQFADGVWTQGVPVAGNMGIESGRRLA